MADWTAEDLANDVLERMGIKAASQAARSEDLARLVAAASTAHAQLRRRRWAPFSVSAIPSWAQTPFSKWLAGEMAAGFQITGQRYQLLKGEQLEAERQLAELTYSRRTPGRRIRARSY